MGRRGGEQERGGQVGRKGKRLLMGVGTSRDTRSTLTLIVGMAVQLWEYATITELILK